MAPALIFGLSTWIRDMIKEGNISEECGKLIKSWWSGQEICTACCVLPPVGCSVSCGQQRGNGHHYQLEPRASLFSLVMDNQSAQMLRYEGSSSGEAASLSFPQSSKVILDERWARGRSLTPNGPCFFGDNEQAGILIKNQIDYRRSNLIYQVNWYHTYYTKILDYL